MSAVIHKLQIHFSEITLQIASYDKEFSQVDDESYEADRLRKEVSFLRQIQDLIKKQIEHLEDERVRVSQDW